MSRQAKYPPELRERAIRMVYEQREHHESQWAAIESWFANLSCGLGLDNGKRVGIGGNYYPKDIAKQKQIPTRANAEV